MAKNIIVIAEFFISNLIIITNLSANAIITNLFNYVNAHNVSAIKLALENKNQLDNIKWNSKKHNQYILARCVEVHARECFELIINTIDFFDEAYESSLEIAKSNYFNFQSDEHFYYVQKILEKKPDLKTGFIKEIISLKNINIFLQNTDMINYNNIIEIESYLLSCIYYGNIQIFELLISSPNICIKDVYDKIIMEIYMSKCAKIFLNIMSKYGFVWTQMASIDFLSMSDNCFEYYLEQLRQLTSENFKKPEFKKLSNYEFLNGCTYYQTIRFYHILKLPIEFIKSKESYGSLLPFICKNRVQMNESYDSMLNTLYMLFELKPELMKQIDILNNELDKIYKFIQLMKHIDILSNQLDKKYKLSYEREENSNIPFIGYIFCQELFHLFKSNGYVLRLEYYEALENFTPKANLAYNKWKINNNLTNKPIDPNTNDDQIEFII